MAADCLAVFDVCGTCTHHHHTANCTNPDSPRCISCGVPCHASWARDCPVFQQMCQELGDCLEDNSLPYFLTLEAWTQVKEPPRVIFMAQPPHLLAMSGRANRGYRQSTLPWADRGVPGRPPNPQQNLRLGSGQWPPAQQLGIPPPTLIPCMSSTLGPAPVRLNIWQQNLNKSRAVHVDCAWRFN